MILDSLFKHFGSIKKYQSLVKAALVLAPLFTFRIKRQNDVSTNEPVQHYLDRNISITTSSDGRPFFDNNRFVLNSLPPRLTLRIQGCPEQKENYHPVISTLRSMDIRNINVVIDLNPPDEKCIYLFEIDLRFEDKTCMLIHPLKNHQPNSDFLLVAGEFFPCKMVFDPMDIFLTNIPSNRLYILLRNTPRGLKTFMSFVRSISFVRTHPYGSYFYIPTNGAYIDVIMFMPLVLSVLAYYTLDWVCVPHSVSTTRIFLGALLYSFFPVSFLFFIRRNESLCLAPIFMVLNPKVGLGYIGICYLRMVCDVLAIAKSIRKPSTWT
ncbi:hypothetical protein [Encephalitozoon cuniculi GB-M1]|uniref:Uncharacterized protein n=2 Tax=Encephalitozoon cuniculi TaxID=6035 RepID=Q8SV07_ENCCU|nr:uncharacterized protein ECU07_0810 [Encephalitozoon cuniculi GB-M1]KMV65805.1 hypothetical protein M970_070760 [Encephalitozoon cuniculi EcunIII-L]UYI27239.1 hypothetical protein J0A71_05g10970 [Encephalitozoon cuniculi]CAD25613.2 hypothetical protein [Encephalitozoon cuniculi GB-M1]